MNEITSVSGMVDLLEALQANEEACNKIVMTYQKAAELDLEFKSLKEKERKIRMLIAIKVNCNG